MIEAQLSTCCAGHWPREEPVDFTPYIPRVVREWQEDDPDCGTKVIPGSLVFIDISGFTAMSERLASKGKIGAEEVTEVLAASFTSLLAAAYDEGGSLLQRAAAHVRRRAYQLSGRSGALAEQPSAAILAFFAAWVDGAWRRKHSEWDEWTRHQLPRSRRRSLGTRRTVGFNGRLSLHSRLLLSNFGAGARGCIGKSLIAVDR
jgi:hypothetical protein